MTTATIFSTHWGNALQGIYIDWEAFDTNNIRAKLDIRMYGVGMGSQVSSSVTDLGQRADADTMLVYFNFMNPWDIDDYNTGVADSSDNAKYYNVLVPFDGMVATLTYNVAGDLVTGTVKDFKCDNTITDGKYVTSSCPDDTAGDDDYTDVTGVTELCKQAWTVSTTYDTAAASPTYADEQRCVRAELKVSRARDPATNVFISSTDGSTAYDIIW